MLNWIKNKITQSEINSCKEEMEKFLIFLQSCEERHLATIVDLADEWAELTMQRTSRNLYDPLSCLENKQPISDGTFMLASSDAFHRGEHELGYALKLWQHTFESVRYPELAGLSLRIWYEFADRVGVQSFPNAWPEEMLYEFMEEIKKRNSGRKKRRSR